MQLSFQTPPKYSKWVGWNRSQASAGPDWNGSLDWVVSQDPFGVKSDGVVQGWGGNLGTVKPLQSSWSILNSYWQTCKEQRFLSLLTKSVKCLKHLQGAEAAPAFTGLSHTGQRKASANAGLAQKLNNEEMFTLLLLLLLLPLLRDWFYSCKLSGSHHSCTGATIKGPNVEGRVWLSPKMSDTNALFMQEAYNAPQFLSSEQIAPLSTSATWFFISDTCLCSYSTSEARWPGCLPEMVVQDKFSSNAV